MDLTESLDKYRSGYPRYSAFLSAHPSFQNFRRFTRVRMRLLLRKQDEISALEERLDSLDSCEDHEIFLGSMRRDNNLERLQVLRDLGTAIAEYDELVERCRQVLSLPESWDRDKENLRRWTAGTRSLSRRELKYLDMNEDLMNLTGSPDTAITLSESVVEDCTFWLDRTIGWYFPGLRKKRYRITMDENIFLLGRRMRQLSRVLAIIASSFIILTPTLILPRISSSGGRMAASVFSAILFLCVVAFFTRARTVEVFASGASYMAVLVAFTVGNETPGGGCCK